MSNARSGPRWPAGRTKSRPEPGAAALVVPQETGAQPPQSQAWALGTAATDASASTMSADRNIGAPLGGVTGTTGAIPPEVQPDPAMSPTAGTVPGTAPEL